MRDIAVAGLGRRVAVAHHVESSGFRSDDAALVYGWTNKTSALCEFKVNVSSEIDDEPLGNCGSSHAHTPLGFDGRLI